MSTTVARLRALLTIGEQRHAYIDAHSQATGILRVPVRLHPCDTNDDRVGKNNRRARDNGHFIVKKGLSRYLKRKQRAGLTASNRTSVRQFNTKYLEASLRAIN